MPLLRKYEMNNDIFLMNVIGALKVVIKMCESKIEDREGLHLITTETAVEPILPSVVIGGRGNWSNVRRSTQFRTSDPRGYVSWNIHEDYDLTEMFNCGTSMNGLTSYHGRSLGSIKSRLILLKLTDVFGNKI